MLTRHSRTELLAAPLCEVDQAPIFTKMDGGVKLEHFHVRNPCGSKTPNPLTCLRRSMGSLLRRNCHAVEIKGLISTSHKNKTISHLDEICSHFGDLPSFGRSTKLAPCHLTTEGWAAARTISDNTLLLHNIGTIGQQHFNSLGFLLYMEIRWTTKTLGMLFVLKSMLVELLKTGVGPWMKDYRC